MARKTIFKQKYENTYTYIRHYPTLFFVYNILRLSHEKKRFKSMLISGDGESRYAEILSKSVSLLLSSLW